MILQNLKLKNEVVELKQRLADYEVMNSVLINEEPGNNDFEIINDLYKYNRNEIVPKYEQLILRNEGSNKLHLHKERHI